MYVNICCISISIVRQNVLWPYQCACNCVFLLQGLTHLKPVIAAVSGYAVAGGLGLALMCDMRVAKEDATFGVAASVTECEVANN